MGFGPFVLLSLFYTVIALGVVRDLARNWRPTFDRRFTVADRMLVDKAAFFVLVPISVALHEFGHALAIWALGGAVIDFGYYVFAGYVAYDEPFSDVQQVVVALAGSLVNVALCAGAIGWVFLRRPPMRAAFNELLVQFAIVSGINALVVYPLLDFGTGLGGDWSQIYGDAPRPLALTIGAVHLALLGGAWWAWRSPPVRTRFAALTGAPAGIRLGGLASPGRPGGQGRQGSGRPTGMRPSTAVGGPPPATPLEATLREAATRVAGGWPVPVRIAVQRRPPNGTGGGDVAAVALNWAGRGDGEARGVVVRPSLGALEIWGQAGPADGVANGARAVDTLADTADVAAVTLGLRLAMEQVDGWPVGRAAGHPS